MSDNVGITELWQRMTDVIRGAIRTATPGRLQTYDRSEHTGDTVPQVSVDGEAQAVLPDVPVFVIGGGDGYLVFPHETGDTGLIIACDTPIGQWRRSGEVRAPEDTGRHSLTGATFLPGLRTVDDTVATAAGATILSGGDVRLGDSAATKKAVHEDLLADLRTFLIAIDVWGATGHANWAVAAAAWIVGVQPTVTVMTGKIVAGSYRSSSVSVEH